MSLRSFKVRITTVGVGGGQISVSKQGETFQPRPVEYRSLKVEFRKRFSWVSLHASWIVNLSSSRKDRGNRNVDCSTCHEDVLVSSYEEVEQVRIAHAVHRGNDQLAELKLRVVSEGGFAKGVGCVENEDVRTVRRKTEGVHYRTQAVHYKDGSLRFREKGHVLRSVRRAAMS